MPNYPIAMQNLREMGSFLQSDQFRNEIFQVYRYPPRMRKTSGERMKFPKFVACVEQA